MVTFKDPAKGKKCLQHIEGFLGHKRLPLKIFHPMKIFHPLKIFHPMRESRQNLGTGWSSSVQGNGGNSNCCNKGDRVPAVFLNEDGRLRVVNSVGGNGNHGFESSNQERIRPGKWYKVTIEQVSQAGKVRMDILVAKNSF